MGACRRNRWPSSCWRRKRDQSISSTPVMLRRSLLALLTELTTMEEGCSGPAGVWIQGAKASYSPPRDPPPAPGGYSPDLAGERRADTTRLVFGRLQLLLDALDQVPHPGRVEDQ